MLRVKLTSAEAVARSGLGRALYILEDASGALTQLGRAVGRRREVLRLRTLIGPLEQNHESVVAEAHRALASTLINYGGLLAATAPAIDAGSAMGGAPDAASARALLGEALVLARLSGDVGVEQAALTQLINCQGGGGESTDAAAALKQLLARTGRAVDGACAVCLEPLGEMDVQALGCGHMLHKACFERWLQHSNACPQCRRGMLG